MCFCTNYFQFNHEKITNRHGISVRFVILKEYDTKFFISLTLGYFARMAFTNKVTSAIEMLLSLLMSAASWLYW